MKGFAVVAFSTGSFFVGNDNQVIAQNIGPGGFTPSAQAVTATPPTSNIRKDSVTANFNPATADTDSGHKKEAPKVKVYDMRQYPDSVTYKNAGYSSTKGVLVITVDSDRQEYIDLVEEVANEIIASGKERIGIILAKHDAHEPEMVHIGGNGKSAYTLLPGHGGVTQSIDASRADLVKTITTAYEKLIDPLFTQKQVNSPAVQGPR